MSISGPLSSSRLRAVTAGVVVTLALLPWLDVATARAATLEVRQGTGLTEPAGLVETPDGELWAADAARGVCRVDSEANPAPVASQFCVVATEDEDAPQPQGPRAAFQPTRSRLAPRRLERPTVLFGAARRGTGEAR